MDIVLHPSQRRLQVAPGANLLAALRAHEVPVSYSCQAGRCGTCRCRVLAGAMPGNADAHGMVLACQTTLDAPCTIEVTEPDEVVLHPARVLKGTVVAIDALAHDVRRLRLRLARPLEFSPGQYVQLQFDAERSRPYSMAGLADDEVLEFHVRVVPGGRVSGFIADGLRPGAVVRVSGPLGCAYLRRKHAGPMLLVGGGTGLAPVLSVLRGALAAGMRNPMQVYFGVRSMRDAYGWPALQAMARDHAHLQVHLVAAEGEVEPGVRCGLVADAIRADLPPLAGWRAYLCGSPPMVEAVTLMVSRLGVDAPHIHADAFYAQPH